MLLTNVFGMETKMSLKRNQNMSVCFCTPNEDIAAHQKNLGHHGLKGMAAYVEHAHNPGLPVTGDTCFPHAAHAIGSN